VSHIAFHDVEVTYPGGLKALKGVTSRSRAGQFVVIVGLSGAGKSTLIRTVNNLVVPEPRRRLRSAGASVTRPGAQLRRMRSGHRHDLPDLQPGEALLVLRNVLAGRLGAVHPLLGVLGLFPRADVAIAHDCLRGSASPRRPSSAPTPSRAASSSAWASRARSRRSPR
jgi:phosphonate transport system ATP-binding protein